MGYTCEQFLFGMSGIGKTSLFAFLTNGVKADPEGNPTTIFIAKISKDVEGMPFYESDWEEVAQEVFPYGEGEYTDEKVDEMRKELVEEMLKDSLDYSEPRAREILERQLKRCNCLNIEDQNIIKEAQGVNRILSPEQRGEKGTRYSLAKISGRDAGGQFDEILPEMGVECMRVGYNMAPSFVNTQESIRDLVKKFDLLRTHTGDYKWPGSYYQLQAGESDEEIHKKVDPDAFYSKLKTITDEMGIDPLPKLPICYTSSLAGPYMNRKAIIKYMLKTAMRSGKIVRDIKAKYK